MSHISREPNRYQNIFIDIINLIIKTEWKYGQFAYNLHKSIYQNATVPCICHNQNAWRNKNKTPKITTTMNSAAWRTTERLHRVEWWLCRENNKETRRFASHLINPNSGHVHIVDCACASIRTDSPTDDSGEFAPFDSIGICTRQYGNGGICLHPLPQNNGIIFEYFYGLVHPTSAYSPHTTQPFRLVSGNK